MITLSIYKKIGKQCGDIRNLHKAVKTLWQIVEQKEAVEFSFYLELESYLLFRIQRTSRKLREPKEAQEPSMLKNAARYQSSSKGN
jgi:hypothetical protein